MKLMEKGRYIAMGLVLGILLTLSVGPIAAATRTISVYLRPDIQYVFDGQLKPLPEEYTTLVHEGRAYLPIRFVSENLGYHVLWDDVNQRVLLTSPELPEPVEPEVPDEPVEEPAPSEEPTEEPAAPEEPKQPEGSYRALPITRYYDDLEATVQVVVLRDTENRWTGGDRVETTRVYLRIENKGSNPYEIRQAESVAIVDGKEYRTKDVVASRWDPRWYAHIRRDEITEGFIALPDIPEDSELMKLTVVAIEQGHVQKEVKMTFDIRLDLKN